MLLLGKIRFSVADQCQTLDYSCCPQIGRILAFRKNKKEDEVKLAWYYRPEECRDGRKVSIHFQNRFLFICQYLTAWSLAFKVIFAG